MKDENSGIDENGEFDENSKFVKDIVGIIEEFQVLIKAAVLTIEPEVNRIIRNRITDKKQIETLLDRLLDYAGMDEKGLMLFKRLCRHYYYIDPYATAEYVYTYRDLYDSDEEDEEDDE